MNIHFTTVATFKSDQTDFEFRMIFEIVALQVHLFGYDISESLSQRLCQRARSKVGHHK